MHAEEMSKAQLSHSEEVAPPTHKEHLQGAPHTPQPALDTEVENLQAALQAAHAAEELALRNAAAEAQRLQGLVKQEQEALARAEGKFRAVEAQHAESELELREVLEFRPSPSHLPSPSPSPSPLPSPLPFTWRCSMLMPVRCARPPQPR